MRSLVQAYADYNDLMDMTEELVSEMVYQLKGSYKIQYHTEGPDSPPVEIDFSRPWRRLSMITELEKVLEVKIPADLTTEEARQFFIRLVGKFALSSMMMASHLSNATFALLKWACRDVSHVLCCFLETECEEVLQ